MATVKKANVPPTHPTVYVGLALAAIGLLLAMFAYTGARVYDILYAFIALGGAALALAGIMTAAWGRSIMAARAARSRRTAMTRGSLAMGKAVAIEEPRGSEEMPTIAAPAAKKRFSFPKPLRAKKEEKPKEAAALFAFKRRAEPAAPPLAKDDPRHPEVAATLAAEAPPAAPLTDAPVRVTLKCPQCAAQFSAEGVRPFEARCASCGFASTV